METYWVWEYGLFEKNPKRQDSLNPETTLEVVKAANAQATIAALQAQVKELEQWVQDQSTANLETMRHTDEMQSRALEAEQQLAQRTAERDCVRRRVDELEAREVDVVLLREDLEKRTAELEAIETILDIDSGKTTVEKVRDLHHSFKQVWESYQDASNEMFKAQAELERVRAQVQQLEKDNATLHQFWMNADDWLAYNDKQAAIQRERDILRTLVAALPKVEGAVVVSNGYVKDSTRCHALFGADEDAASYAALLQHRQRVEG